MFKCHGCGSTESHRKLISQTFQVEGRPVLVENIPATICSRCGEAIFDVDIVERVRRMVHGEVKPVKSVSMDVFEYV
ncbi:MAG: YgiT-type zinc finger protein [Ignavibacteriales bacterium]|nr:YgiT-type zinc finger protein [Ignavibacteriales bacterium]MBI3789095.1 YgiT-type zinc finger protein [Ignavibacteriales bacterium]